MNKDRIYDSLKRITEKKSIIDSQCLSEFSAGNIADKLNLKRNAVSHYLNELNKEGLVLKINTRPVYFIAKEVLEKKVCQKISRLIFSSIEEMIDYINKISVKKEQCPFIKAIGYNNSLKYQIEQCKAATNYPGNGLPCLILGSTGVGKSFLASVMFEYSKKNKIIEEEAPFVILNCAEFADNPELLTANLFGYAKGAFTGADDDRIGLIEEANNGFIFLDEVHRLSPESQEKLFLFMDKGIYRRLGENSGWRKSRVRFIFATTEEPNDVLISTFLRRIPIVIDIPPLKMRSSKEKLQLIYSFFKEEAINLQRCIIISKQVINVLLNAEFPGNVGQLRNIIKYTCAKVYVKYINDSKDKDVRISLNYLSDELLKLNISNLNNFGYGDIPLKEIRIDYSKEIDNDYFIEDNKLNLIEELYKEVISIHENVLKKKINPDTAIAKSMDVIESYFDRLIYKYKNKNNIDIKFDTVRKVLNNILELMKNNYGLKFYSNTVLVLAYYITNWWELDSFQNIATTKTKINILNFLKANYPKEYNISMKLIRQIETNLDIKMNDEDKLILTVYIKGSNKNFDINRVRAVILAHGYSTASSIANVANRLLGQYIFESFDMAIDVSTEELIKQLKSYISEVDTSKGIIILVDMGSLEEIHKSLAGMTQGIIGIVNNITTQLALDTGSKIIEGKDIEEIAEIVTKNNRSIYKLIKPKKNERKAILTTCITGIGTANKIKDLLTESIGENSKNIEIIAHDYISLKNNGEKDRVFNNYNIIAIVGTANPGVEDIPFIALEDIISGTGEEKLAFVLRDIIEKDTIDKINECIVRNFSLQSVLKYLTILNPEIIIQHIEIATNELQIGIGKRFPNELKISLYVHISCLIERLIKKSPINEYENINEFKQCHKKFIDLTKKSFSVIEETYRINIPVSEIGYIYDIVRLKISNLHI